MKTIVLLITGLLFGIMPVSAENKSASQGEDLNRTRYYDQPITFIERGVEFIIFPDGSFDFNTELNTTPGNGYYKTNTVNKKRTNINRTFGAPGIYNYYNYSPQGVIITHDRFGRVRRVGNVFLNYNRIGQIRRIGSIYMNYNRYGLLRRVGGLHIHYHGNIISHLTGFINWYNRNCNICGVRSCNTNHFNNNNTQPHHIDNDFYYYKKDGKEKKVKKIKRS